MIYDLAAFPSRELVLEFEARLAERLRKMRLPSSKTAESLANDLAFAHLPVLKTICEPSLRTGQNSWPPLLTPLVRRSLQNWLDSTAEIFSALENDRALIEEMRGAPLPPVSSLSAPGGDFHRGGRSVRILKFEDGFQLVYKPRSLGVDQSFQNVLRWFNELNPLRSLRLLKTLDRGDYGWAEFITTSHCPTTEGAKRFDERMGELLAIAYVLGGTDMHFQNILAAGEDPVAIDLETLFHRFPRHTEKDAVSGETLAYLAISNSVSSVGILPWPIPVGPGSWLNMGGLGGRFHPPGTLSRLPAANRPFIGEKIYEPDMQAVAAGFESAYRILIENKEALLSENGPLSAFKNQKVRVVVQGTYVYQSLLRQSYEPALLESESVRREFFASRIKNGPPGVLPFVESEVAQLLNGDIPSFEVETDSDILVGADGSQISAVAGVNGWQGSRRRMEALSMKELEFQKQILFATFGIVPPAIAQKDTTALKSEVFLEGESASWITSHQVLPGEDLFAVEPINKQEAADLSHLFDSMGESKLARAVSSR